MDTSNRLLVMNTSNGLLVMDITGYPCIAETLIILNLTTRKGNYKRISIRI